MSKKRKKSYQPDPPVSSPPRSKRPIMLALAGLVPLLVGGLVFADWWTCLPEDTVASYTGRDSCVTCHQAQHQSWQGSFHDLAMDLATPETVLGDFDDATLEHFGITSKMFKRDGKFMINTEGPDGKLADFEVKYVFGVDPLQQYMVEFDRSAETPADEVSRVQVLRVSWDTQKKHWFYLTPPDVRDEKLPPTDPLHWTGIAQCWNTTCAECHSTNLQKRYDVTTASYHTTFSEIDVSCEACHGPGSTHVELATQRSLFWDRKQGYGLVKLKSKDSKTQIETCARCHARQRTVHPDWSAGNQYHDHFANTLILEDIYHADGQLLDEDYVYGSFIQSKMYHKNIRCTDCHDPHSTKVKFTDNRLCTSCHQHPAGKYDGTRHHFHHDKSTGAKCVECHMPETTYMDVDPRRDHSFKVPRPDLSVKLGTPNACSRCHLSKAQLADEKREGLRDYADWINAARQGDQDVRAALAKLDAWAATHTEKWYGKPKDTDTHFANAIKSAWDHDRAALDDLLEIASDRKQPGMIRASALMQTMQFDDPKIVRACIELVGDREPQVATTAIGFFQSQVLGLNSVPPQQRPAAVANVAPVVELLQPLLTHETRLVRTEAARILMHIPPLILAELTSGVDRKQLDEAMDELVAGLMVNNDRAHAHLSLGILHEARGDDEQAIESYRTAIRVEPDVLAPRRNLAALFDRKADAEDREIRNFIISSRQNLAPRSPAMEAELQTRIQEVSGKITAYREQATQLRLEELELLRHRAEILPNDASSQYEYGLQLALFNEEEQAHKALLRASELDPNEPQYLFGLALFYEKFKQWDQAVVTARKLITLRPEIATYRDLYQRLKTSQADSAASDGDPES